MNRTLPTHSNRPAKRQANRRLRRAGKAALRAELSDLSEP